MHHAAERAGPDLLDWPCGKMGMLKLTVWHVKCIPWTISIDTRIGQNAKSACNRFINC